MQCQAGFPLFPFRRMRFSFLGKWHVTIKPEILTWNKTGDFSDHGSTDLFINLLVTGRKYGITENCTTNNHATVIDLTRPKGTFFKKYDQPLNGFLLVDVYLDSLLWNCDLNFLAQRVKIAWRATETFTKKSLPALNWFVTQQFSLFCNVHKNGRLVS